MSEIEEAMRESLEGTFTTYVGSESFHSYDKRDPLQVHYSNIRTKLRRAAVIASRNAAAAAVAPIPKSDIQSAILSLRPLMGANVSDAQFKAGLSKMSTLLQMTSAVTGVPLQDLKSYRRETVICRARHIFFWLCKHYTPCSFPQIGNYLGKHHSTVLHGVKKVNFRLADYPEIEKIKELLGCHETP